MRNFSKDKTAPPATIATMLANTRRSTFSRKATQAMTAVKTARR